MMQSLHKRYVGIKDSSGNYNFCNALWEFKNFMVTNGWSVTKSGYSTSTSSDYSSSGDVLLAQSTMSSTIVWFVLRSINNRQEFLFYRDASFQTDATSSGLYIAYSALSTFSSVYGINNGIVEADTPPMAFDAVWITGYPDIYMDLYNDLLTFPAPPVVPSLPPSDLLYSPGLTSGSVWYFHAILNTSPPYSFYFFNTTFSTSISAQGFFCADGVSQQGTDNDPFVFLNFPSGISLSQQKLFAHSKQIRAWYGLTSFASRQDYLYNISTNQARFLPTAPLSYNAIVNNGNYNINYTVSSGVIVDNTNPDQESCENLPAIGNIPLTENNVVYLLPLYYTKGNVLQGSQSNLFSFSDMPATYKGKSSTILIPSNNSFATEMSTMNYVAQNDYILIGKNAQFALQWDGTVPQIT